MSRTLKKVEISSGNFSIIIPTAILICNGPSLRDVPNEWLASRPSFGANRIFLKFNPNYLAIVDLKMVHTPELAAEAAAHFPLSDEVFLSTDAAERLGDLPDNARVMNWKNVMDKNDKLLGAFGHDPTKILVSGGTVTYGLMQLAFWKGYRRLLIVGLDHDFTGPGGDHFTTEYNEPVGIPYEGNLKAGWGAGNWYWDADTFYAKTAKFFMIAREVFEEAGGEIINCTPNTKLDVFPIADWRDYA